MVPLGAADGAKENGFGLVAGFKRLGWERRAARIDRRAPDERFGLRHFKAEALGRGVKHLERFAHDFGADAVAGENCDVMGFRHDVTSLAPLCSWGNSGGGAFQFMRVVVREVLFQRGPRPIECGRAPRPHADGKKAYSGGGRSVVRAVCLIRRFRRFRRAFRRRVRRTSSGVCATRECALSARCC